MAARVRLVVNADDFGFTRDVNRGIVEAHARGILTATTLMATGAAFDDALQLARENPTLDVGVHCVLVGAPGQPATVSQFLRALVAGRVNVYAELRAQVERVVAAGLRPTHLDTHKHTHILPPVLAAVARLAEEFGIRWVRRPMLPGAGRILSRRGCRTTDHFRGFALTGRFTADDLVRVIRGLKAGSTEFMCHPGYCTDELRSARTRLKENREQELRALTAPEVRAELAARGVELCSYAEL